MKRADFKQGRTGFIIRVGGEKIGTPHIYIEEVEIEGLFNDGTGQGAVWDYANEEEVIVTPGQVFYSREDARKALLRYHSRQFKKIMEGRDDA